ncbi:unnamed protein product [Caenorhabditis angaria]|uniref:DNA2/NAM7 helicase-like C-terminal domain-containing protein n=1 Tax=Caenorhabditis angaria TaxID=860376 RepID=A0A9P1ISS0_9PELO|nr:unnamed protein product [Caenorhabditis angaria]
MTSHYKTTLKTFKMTDVSQLMQNLNISGSGHPWNQYYSSERSKKEPVGYKQLLSRCSLEQIQRFRNASEQLWLNAPRTTNSSQNERAQLLTSDLFPQGPFAYYSVAYKSRISLILTPVFNEVAAHDRLDLKIVILNKNARDTLNEGKVNLDDHPIGDVLCITKLQQNQTRQNIRRIDRIELKDVLTVHGKNFWEVCEFFPMGNDIIEKVITTPYIEVIKKDIIKGKRKQKRGKPDEKILMCVGSNMGNILMTTVFMPIIKPGQFISSLEQEHWLTVAKISPKLRTTNTYLPVVMDSTTAPEYVQKLFKDYQKAFAIRNRAGAYEALKIVVKHGSNGLRAIHDSKIDDNRYTTRIENYKRVEPFVFFTFKLIGASFTPPAMKWNRAVSVQITSPVCLPFVADVLGAHKDKMDLRVKARAPSHFFDEYILRDLKRCEISVKQRREVKKYEIDWDIKEGTNADKFIQAIYGGRSLVIPNIPKIPSIEIGGLQLLATQTRYAQLIAHEKVPALIGSSSFGCGKTAAIAAAALYAIKKIPEQIQMLTAVTNSAAVSIIEKLVQLDPKIRIVRIISPANMLQIPSTLLTRFDYPTVLFEHIEHIILREDAASDSHSYTIPEGLLKQMLYYIKKTQSTFGGSLTSERLRRLFIQAKNCNDGELLNYFMETRKPQIIVGTIQTIINSFSMSWRPFINMISTIQIDEASTVPRETLLQVVSLFPNSKYSLVGDYRQLSPYFEMDASKLLIDTAIGETLRDCVTQHLLPSVYFNGVFRFRPEITQQLGKLFYDSSLKSLYRPCHTEEKLATCEAWRLQRSNNFPMIFIDTIRSKARIRGQSLRNHQEATIVKNLVEHLVEFISTDDIAILCFYRAQMMELQNLSEDFGIHVGCVDSGQGREWPVCIICTTRTSLITDDQFVSNARRINVALSRSKHLNFILGNKQSFTQSNLWSDIIMTCLDAGTLVKSYEFNAILKSENPIDNDPQGYDDAYIDEEQIVEDEPENVDENGEE